ncbi:exodeoxyribonuclease VII large subunit [Candidatus Saccharibacteria bacterium TM7i]|nr:exodeoxyribonuclease VII large subunit [Candidatus Saccharibacteria bacterium TM7i]
MENIQLSVSDFVALVNQSLEYAYPVVTVVGEVAEFKVSQGKWVSFKLKDAGAVVNCFMSVYQLRIPLEDGMKVMVQANPRLNPKGYFNLNIRVVKPVGEGSIKKGFELLKEKLEKEGLFAPERKRLLPRTPAHIGVITSTESAAYADFCTILNQRWGGLKVTVAHTQVQGDPAADQMIRAINYMNELEDLPEVLVIIRGGGAAEDLMAFNDELLARAVAASRIPTLVGVGHEIDHTLADMVADVRAATPTDAAKIVVPDKQEMIRDVRQRVVHLGATMMQRVDEAVARNREALRHAYRSIEHELERTTSQLGALKLAIEQVNPAAVLRQGYAILRGKTEVGERIQIETSTKYIEAEITSAKDKGAA